MFRISIKDTSGQRRLVLQGELVRPWIAEVESAWRHAADQLQGRRLVIDLNDVTVISPEGEDTLLKLMREGAHFSCCDVFTKHVVKRLARRCREAIARIHSQETGTGNTV